MARGFELKGLDATLKEVRRAANVVGSDAKKEIERAVRNTERDAKRNAPVDTGELRNGIVGEITQGGYNGTVTANAPHSPYLEFGTGGKVDVPQEFESVAREFVGDGVRQVDIAPQPFLIPAYVANVTKLIERLKKAGGLRWK